MNQTIPPILRSLLALWALCLLVGLAIVISLGALPLLKGVLLGLAAGAVCIGTLVYRTWKSARLSPMAAKAQMLWGLVVRLFAAAAALLFAAQDGKAMLFSAAAALITYYVLSLLAFVRAARRAMKEG